MARVPYQPFSDSSTAVPGPTYQDINASPDAFGAAVGRGLQQVGQGAEAAGNSLFKGAVALQERYNQVTSDNAFNKLQEGYFKLTYGDPNDPNSKGIYGMSGADAMNARQPTMAAMEQLRSQISATLPNDATRVQFDQASRRLQMYTADSIGRHVDQEFNRYALGVNNATLAVNGQTIGANYNNEDAFLHSLEDMKAAAVKSVQIQYGANPDPAIVKEAIQKATSEAVKARVLGWGRSDPSAALNWLNTQQGNIDPLTFEVLSRSLTPQADHATVSDRTNRILNPVQATPASLGVAISGSEGPGTSDRGAFLGVMPDTFKQYAKPGESFQNADDVKAVRARVIDDLWQKTNGDPDRVAVGFFSGPGNIAPAGSPTPWIADKNDGHHTTSWYVDDVRSRLAASQTPRDAAMPTRYTDELSMLQRAYEQTRDLRPDLAERVQQNVFHHMQQMNEIENQAESQADRHLKMQQTDNEALLFSAAVRGQPINEGDLATYLRTQRISPSGYNAIKAVQIRRAEGVDDPLAVARIWDGVEKGQVTLDDITNGVTGGVIKGTTADEMIKAMNARQRTEANQIERGAYDTLRTALNGKAIESGNFDVFGTNKQAAAQLWSQAQGEWNRRVIVGKEDPNAVLQDMMPRYVKAVPSAPEALPNPRFGAVSTVPEVASVWQKTTDAFKAGQITQQQYSDEAALLNKYRSAFEADAARKAAAAKATGGQTGRRTTLPLAPTDEGAR